jgi:5'(3')-deoxyribonucleotidase
MKLFLDLDGTLARFNVPNALARFETEEGFFFRLKPYKNIEVINKLAETGNVYIISASPNVNADNDKMQWVQKYIPNIPFDNIIICRCGENKATKICSVLDLEMINDCILLDDYTKNLVEWEQSGGIGIKRITSVADNSTKKWKGSELKNLKELEKLLDILI